MIRAVAGRSVTMPVDGVVTRQEAIEGGHQVGIGAGADLEDDQTGRGMRNEDRKQAVARPDSIEKRSARPGEIRQAAIRARPDRDFAAVYGKMLRRASRRRPRPPRAGADS